MPFYGKYRGKVTDNNDPLGRGRARANVPAISGNDLTWAEPCTPYAGPKVGWYAMPPVGANVWVEFENGDVDYPIWSGCFWGGTEDEGVPPDATGPALKVLQTDTWILVFDDENGKLTARLTTGDPPITLEMDAKGIVLTADKTTVTITPDKIELKKDPCTIEVAAAITLKRNAASIAISESITLKNGGTSAEMSQAAIDLKNGASSVSLSPATVSINNGALEVM